MGIFAQGVLISSFILHGVDYPEAFPEWLETEGTQQLFSSSCDRPFFDINGSWICSTTEQLFS